MGVHLLQLRRAGTPAERRALYTTLRRSVRICVLKRPQLLSIESDLGVIGIDVEVGKQKGFIARFVTTSIWFDGDEDSINLRQGCGIVKP